MKTAYKTEQTPGLLPAQGDLAPLLLRRGYAIANGAVAILDDADCWTTEEEFAKDMNRRVRRSRFVVIDPDNSGSQNFVTLPAIANNNWEVSDAL